LSIERTFYCDAAECERHVTTAERRPRGGFLFVGDEMGNELHFCTWDCVLKYAAAIEPSEVIPWNDEEAA
jgi:hypothetical protein